MTDPKKKLEILKGSLDSGIIDKEEYTKWEEKLGSEAKEFDNKIEGKIEEPKTEEQPGKSSEKILIFAIASILLLFSSVLELIILYKQHPKTLDVFLELRMRSHLAIHHRGGRYAPRRAIAIPTDLGKALARS